MSVRVKICGMTSADDIAACAMAGADALGFIFAAGPRRLTVEAASALTGAVPPFVTTVGVFAGDAPELIRSAIDACRLDVLQFSGDEDPALCGSFGKPTILSTRGRRFEPVQLRAARAIALLVDSWSPREYGGTGRMVDVDEIRRVREAHPGMAVILAGGLAPSNVGFLVARAEPDGVDVRSGVEQDGRKDPATVRAFVSAVRAVNG